MGPAFGGWERKNSFISLCLPFIKSCHVSIALPMTSEFCMPEHRGDAFLRLRCQRVRPGSSIGWAWSLPLLHVYEDGPINVWGLSGFDSRVWDSVILLLTGIYPISWESSGDYRNLENGSRKELAILLLFSLNTKT